jgi:hypothetical protein
MEIKEVIKLSEREIKAALSEYVGKRGYTVIDVEFGFKQDFKNTIKVTDVKMEVREATDRELIRPFLSKEIALALDTMQMCSMSGYEVISSLDHEKLVVRDDDLSSAHNVLREWVFEKGSYNMDVLLKALANGYERKDFWMKS